MTKLVQNAAGRMVPAVINGAEAVPFQGVGKFRPSGRKAAPPIRTCSDYPADGNKVVENIKTALQQAGL
ncbi:MAG: citrate lyase subunit alpha, partial [Candidatus Krumholzibacteriia bacterium]